MNDQLPPLVVVPGFKGSGADHWQSWLQRQWPNSTRIDGIDWNEPVLAHWALRIRDVLARTPQPLWIVAHSFGCLAAAVAVADRPEQVAQLILVAPASPTRFDCMGLKPDQVHDQRFLVQHVLPQRALQVSGVLVASRNDPWLTFEDATTLATRWGLDLHDAGKAGHINVDSGHGPWPALLDLLRKRRSRARVTAIDNASQRKGRGSVLAAVRQLTREQLQSPQDHRLWQTARQ